MFRSCAPSGGMTASRREGRAADELVGLCRGLIADGELNSQEAAFLQDWLGRNARVADQFPFNVLIQRLAHALQDGVIDPDEERDLLGAMAQFVGGEAQLAQEEIASLSTALPFDRPVPVIGWGADGQGQPLGARVAVTGTFAYGDREEVMAAISRCGGRIDGSVLKRTQYLIVGEIASRDWVHSNYGRKIERAVALRQGGQRLAIIGERDWVQQLVI